MTDTEKLDLLLSNMQKMQTDINEIKHDIIEMKCDISITKLTIENEIRVNIQRVAEGHLDLSRNMHDAMKPSNEIEMLAIKVSMLETDIRNLKQRIS